MQQNLDFDIYFIMVKTQNIQVVRPLKKDKDATVIQAKKIAEEYKVLPYYTVDKILDNKASNFSLSKKVGS